MLINENYSPWNISRLVVFCHYCIFVIRVCTKIELIYLIYFKLHTELRRFSFTLLALENKARRSDRNRFQDRILHLTAALLHSTIGKQKIVYMQWNLDPQIAKSQLIKDIFVFSSDGSDEFNTFQSSISWYLATTGIPQIQRSPCRPQHIFKSSKFAF